MAMLTITKHELQEMYKISEPCITLLKQFIPQFEEKIKSEAQLGRTEAVAEIGDVIDERSARFISQCIVAEFKDAGFTGDDIMVSYQKSDTIKGDFIVVVKVSWK